MIGDKHDKVTIPYFNLKKKEICSDKTVNTTYKR